MTKILLALFLIFPLSIQAGSMTGKIQVSLTILPSPCIATSSQRSVTVQCGNIKNEVKTVVEKQTAIEKDSEHYIVTINY